MKTVAGDGGEKQTSETDLPGAVIKKAKLLEASDLPAVAESGILQAPVEQDGIALGDGSMPGIVILQAHDCTCHHACNS